jgi:hypothetical protein
MNLNLASRLVLWGLLGLASAKSLLPGNVVGLWATIVFFLTGGKHTLYLIWHSFPRDMRYIL